MADTGNAWLATWLDPVRDGIASMSQRRRSSVDNNGGIDEAIAAARKRGVHLAELTDDKGCVIIAASRHPIRSLC